MSGVIIAGNTSGSVTLSAPDVSGTTVITLPTTTGTMMVNGPAFSAYSAAATTLATGFETQVAFNTEEYDTNSNYNTGNSRFTPTVAGYYSFNATVRYSALLVGNTFYVTLYKNAASVKIGNIMFLPVNGAPSNSVTATIYMNGTTDYVEVFAFQNSGVSVNTSTGASLTYFQASMVRGA